MDDTIGRIVQEQVEAGKLNEDQQEELVHLLRTRFTADLLSMHRYLRNFKQLTYMLTLSNLGSTVAQLTDVAMTAAEHGIPASWSGMKGVLRLGPADRRLVMEDIGQHAYGEEFKDVGPLARRTDQVLTATGFKMMDRFGKEHRRSECPAGPGELRCPEHTRASDRQTHARAGRVVRRSDRGGIPLCRWGDPRG